MRILIPILEHEVPSVDTPKSLYGIEQETINRNICESLSTFEDARITFILNKNDMAQHNLDSIKKLNPCAEIIMSHGYAMGPACSCLLAADTFVDDEPLIIYDSSHLIDVNMKDVVNDFVKKDYDGGVICFDGFHSHHSFVKLNAEGLVIEAAEKREISRHVTSGFYYFKRTEDFLKAAISMIRKEASVDGKYYVCPAYNEMILQGKKIGAYYVEEVFRLRFNSGTDVKMNEDNLHLSL